MPIPIIGKVIALGAKAIGAIGGKKAIGAGLKAIAPSVIGSVLTGNPNKDLINMQNAALAQQMEFNRDITQRRVGIAEQMFREADQFDPTFMGQQAAKAAMTRGQVQKSRDTRGLTGARLAAERRRADIGIGRSAGTAFQQGFSTGLGARTQARQVGIQAMPTQFPSMGQEFWGASGVRAAADARAGDRAAGIGQLIGSVFGNPTGTGTPSDPAPAAQNAGIIPPRADNIQFG